MIELAAIFCAIAAPCKDVNFQYSPHPDEGGVSVMQCMVGAQQELAKWVDQHPGYFVKRWSCGVSGRYAKA
jgi:hypothetical protein